MKMLGFGFDFVFGVYIALAIGVLGLILTKI